MVKQVRFVVVSDQRYSIKYQVPGPGGDCSASKGPVNPYQAHRVPAATVTTDAFPWGAGHGTLRWTRASEQAGKALLSQGHQCAHVM